MHCSPAELTYSTSGAGHRSYYYSANMVQSKAVILAAVLATAVVAVPSNGETNQVTQSDEANLIEAREPTV
ncbi:hypothetical protein PTI98_009795 [Pleurotus ostreatus]|nr:hypothetical protein PTI98_009795 [Pleurotus ostreatus]